MRERESEREWSIYLKICRENVQVDLEHLKLVLVKVVKYNSSTDKYI